MKWERLPVDELALTFDSANGPVQQMREVMHLFSDVACIIKDISGRVLYMNQHAERLWNIRRSDIVGQTMKAVFGERDARRERRQDAAVLASESGMAFFEPRNESQSPFYAVFKFPFQDSDGDTLIAVIRKDFPPK